MTMLSFPSDLLNGHRYGVYGLGRNGMAVVKNLLNLGASVQAWDDHTNSLSETLGHHPHLNHAPLTDLQGFDALILSPGIPHHLPTPHPTALLAQKTRTPILSEAEILWQVVRQSGSKARFISITGTNGKSTTTTLLAHILKEGGLPVATGGNLGTAALALPLLGDEGVYIIEMSSYMLERLQHYHANAAVLLNLTPDHLERHGNMAGYEAAKGHVFDNMGPNDLAVLGEKSAWAERLEKRLKEQHVPVLTLDVQHAVPHALAPALPGRHNAQNIASCHLISQHLGIDDITIERAVKNFKGLEHRLQIVARLGKIRFVNDSKATNAEATAQALAAYDHILWIAGGIAKAGGISNLVPLLQNVAHSFLIGRDAPLLAQTLQEHHHPFTLCETLENAVSSAVIMAQKYNLSTILLSPACASLDQFKNFEERGTCFTLQAQSYSRIPLSQRSH